MKHASPHALIASAIFLSIMAIATQPASAGSEFIYSPPRCSHSVVFPASPEFKELHAGNIQTIQASLYQSDSFMRAECIATPANFVISKNGALGLIKVYAEQNGLQNIVTSADVKNDLVIAEARGTKQVSGRRVTFVIHLFLDSASILILYGGGASETYPQEGIFSFFASASHKNAR